MARQLFPWPGLLVLVLVWLCPALTFAQSDLHQLRAERRLASRQLQADKTGEAALFGLLVIPVDFSDARLPDNWDPTTLSPGLTSTTGESVVHLFQMASNGRLDMRVTLAPLVHLEGSRRDYSDRDLNGFTRTRALATQSLQAVRDLGLEFRRIDMEGPDRTAGTDDDDGLVDGVLILHAAPGQENDPESGLIQPLQFFLDDPVVSDGIAASFYAVASMQSGPGIWAHETAHLLGLEDRYDPLIPSGGSEVQSLGGLGRFSLMASGAWGTGDGYGAALPDAYSRVQMGWVDVQNLPPESPSAWTLSPGQAARIWTRGVEGPEFFLLETRDPAVSAPFDAAVPGGNLLITHIDETLPEGSWSDDGPRDYHLRARLVEADDDDYLRRGLDDGRAEDLFPGPLGVTDFGPSTVPPSDGYSGPTQILLQDITPVPGGVAFYASAADDPSLEFDFGFTDESIPTLMLQARETGTSLSDLTVRIETPRSPTWGQFADGPYTDVLMVESSPGLWVPADAVSWFPSDNVPSGAGTDYTFRFLGTGYDSGIVERTWNWGTSDLTLDFANVWPGPWVIDHPDGVFTTTWHRWTDTSAMTQDAQPVLACTDEGFTTASSWPEVTYNNRGHTTLTSGPLASDVQAVRMVHALEAEVLAAGEAADGALVVWVDPSGAEVPAIPLDSYPGKIATRVSNARHGQQAFFEEPLELIDNKPLWQTDIFPVPDDGPGPWRLRLVFASNSLWRYKGWFVASLEPWDDLTATSAFPVVWDGDLRWQWFFPSMGAQPFEVRGRHEDSGEWSSLWSGTVSPDPVTGWYELDGDVLLPLLSAGHRTRQPVQVIGTNPSGLVASPAVTIYRDGGDGVLTTLSRPWPNPGTAPIRFQLDVPVALTAKVSIFDVRGRLIRLYEYPAGSHLGTWDGHDGGGQRAPAGVYFLRAEGSGPVTTRKVVLLH